MNAMKIRRISNYASMMAMAALLPLGIASGRAASNPSHLDADGAVLEQAQPKRVDWEDERRHKLRRAYWLLESAESDYNGHKGKAMAEIKEAAKVMGLDLHGEKFGTGTENQKRSDLRLREAKQLLKDIIEKPRERQHDRLTKAIEEIDRALEVK